MPSIFESMFAAAGQPAVAGTHGKTLKFLPAKGAARDITVTAVRSGQTAYVERPGGAFLDDTIFVSVMKDPVTGIDRIALGDGVEYCGRGWSFDGGISDELANSWTLQFVSSKPYIRGGNFGQR